MTGASLDNLAQWADDETHHLELALLYAGAGILTMLDSTIVRGGFASAESLSILRLRRAEARARKLADEIGMRADALVRASKNEAA